MKVQLGPFATVARGKLDTTVFSGRGGVDFVRLNRPPRQPDTLSQQRIKRIVDRASDMWGRMFYAVPALSFPSSNPFFLGWQSYVRKRKSTAYGSFVQSYYNDVVAGGGVESVRLLRGNAGFHPVQSVSLSTASNPTRLVVNVQTAAYIQPKFVLADAFVFILPVYNPEGVSTLPPLWIIYRTLRAVNPDTPFSLSIQAPGGLPLPTTNFIGGAGMIYYRNENRRAPGFSTVVQDIFPSS